MMRRVAQLLILALALTTVSARAAAPIVIASAGPVGGETGQSDLYLEAMRAIAEGRADDATALLMRFLEREPQHAGAWLDLAISQCSLGHAAEAEKLFGEIERRFAPPPGIVETINQYRANGCRLAPPKRIQLGMTVSRAHDSNANQGADNGFFRTGSGANIIDWELSPDLRPKADFYSQLALDYAQSLGPTRAAALVQVRARRHDSLNQQDTASGLIGLVYPWRAGNWSMRATGAYGLVQLDRSLYQRQSQLQLKVVPPLALADNIDWSLTTGISHVSYPTRVNYNANAVELGSALEHRGKSSQSLATLGILLDRGNSGRLGGDRKGWYGGVQTRRSLGEYLNGELAYSRQVWRSDAVYSPNQIDILRHQDTQQLRATLSMPLAPQHNLQLEWRHTINRENISLFQYNSRVIQLSWRWNNF